jgi:formylglycine-generating enzyme required for sulfatase activity
MAFLAATVFFGKTDNPMVQTGGETPSGKVQISSMPRGATIYVNGRRKATVGEGLTDIFLEEGEYEIRVEKATEDGNWVYRGKKLVFVGSNTSVQIDIPTVMHPTEKQRQEREKMATLGLENFDFVLIQPGTFLMGSPPDEPERYDDEKQHRVTIARPFYMQATEVTQGQWRAVMGSNPSSFSDCGDDCPVDQVSWEDAQQFIRKVNEITGKNHRLPTEAEWEYAARAGTTTPFYTGTCLGTNRANYNGEYPLPGCANGEYRKKTLPVGSFSPNPWGLYDMHGNVGEWCQDWYGEYPSQAVTDPAGPTSGSARVLRGGGWRSFGRLCRAASRFQAAPSLRIANDGFRLVRPEVP